MVTITIDNDGTKFLEEFKTLCNKYVKSASPLKIDFKDGHSIGMRTALMYALGYCELKDCIKL